MRDIHEIKEMFRMAGRVRKFIILTLMRSPFEAMRTIIQANFLHYAFEAIAKRNLNDLFTACALFGVGSLLLFLYNGTVWVLYSTYVVKWADAIRRKLFRHISCLSLQQIEDKPSGEWITRLNIDVHAATALLNQNFHIPHAAVSTVSIFVSSVILVLINPGIFGLVIVFVISHILISQLFIAKPMTQLSLKVQEAAARNAADMNALVTCAETACLYNAQGFLMKHFEESSLELRKANMRIEHRKAVGNGLLMLMGMGGFLLILLVCGRWIGDGVMTFGQLAAAFQYRSCLLMGSMMLINSLINIKTALAGVKRVNETMCMTMEE